MGDSLGTNGAGGMCSVVGTTLRQEDNVKSSHSPLVWWKYDMMVSCSGRASQNGLINTSRDLAKFCFINRICQIGIGALCLCWAFYNFLGNCWVKLILSCLVSSNLRWPVRRESWDRTRALLISCSASDVKIYPFSPLRQCQFFIGPTLSKWFS